MRANIIATIGEESLKLDLKKIIDALIEKGIMHFRFNLSKCMTYGELKNRAILISQLKKTYGNDIYTMVDLPYPGEKIRLYNPKKNFIYIEKGEIITIESSNSPIHKDEAFISNVEDIDEFVGDREEYIYADGEICFQILSKSRDNKNIVLKAENYGKMYSSKSLMFGKVLPSKIEFMQLKKIVSSFKFDAIALSFVSNANSIIQINNILSDTSIAVYSKIETQESINHISEISKVSNIMVGRGDLLLNSNMYQLYDFQKKAIEEGKRNNKYTAIATGILSTMAQKCIPSQSEMIDMAVLKLLDPDYVVLNSSLIRGENLDRVIEVIKKC